MRIFWLLFWLSLICTCAGTTSAATLSCQNTTCLYYFTGIGCTHCAQTDPLVLGTWLDDYPGLVIIEYEIYEERGNTAVFDEMVREYGTGVVIPLLILSEEEALCGDGQIITEAPLHLNRSSMHPPSSRDSTVSIQECNFSTLCGRPNIWHGDRILIRTGPGGDNILLQALLTTPDLDVTLKGEYFERVDAIQVQRSGDAVTFDHAILVSGWRFQWRGEGLANDTIAAGPPHTQPPATGDRLMPTSTLTLGRIIALALVDAINPCALAVLSLVLLSIMTGNPQNPRKVMWAGIAYAAAIFVTYCIYGVLIVGVFSASGLVSHYRSDIGIIFGLVSLILGLVQLHDAAVQNREGHISHLPQPFRRRINAIVRRITSVPTAFLLGAIVTLFLLPCTIGPYILAGALLSPLGIGASLPYLLLYNAVFVLPMLAITICMVMGYARLGDMSAWRKSHLRAIHGASGIILLVLGLGLIFGFL